ncbi:DinB family protein [Fictibacillus gelatini]|uniref:DinB family protein n=1 Tax=Fictibacillus gelatini TaxID=225985 RepID=UPI0004019055|nr:DinB family protein [Fictibacillus gelatini]
MDQVKQFMDNWLRHRNVLEKLIETIGDEHVSFKPWDGAMALGELVLHTVYWNDTFISLLKTGQFEAPEISDCQTMKEVRQKVSELTEKTKDSFASLNDEVLEAEFTFLNFPGTGRTFLTMMYDHEIHHKGQLFVYARLIGVKDLPFFRDYK